MIGAQLHTVIRAQGRWEDSGDWNPTAVSEQFDVYGTLTQTSPRMVIMDPNAAPVPAASWTLALDLCERPLMISSRDDTRSGDRVQHGDRLLAVVGHQELPGVGGLPTGVYILIDPGQDPTEVQR